MIRTTYRARLAGGAMLVLVATPAMAQAVDPAALDRYIRQSVQLCRQAASHKCIDRGWQFADADGNGTLSAGELGSLRGLAQLWYARRKSGLHQRDRALLSTILLIAGLFQPQRFIAALDGDGDNALSRAELLADITLDDRTLGAVLSDPKAVDRESMRVRFPEIAPLLDMLAAQ